MVRRCLRSYHPHYICCAAWCDRDHTSRSSDPRDADPHPDLDAPADRHIDTLCHADRHANLHSYSHCHPDQHSHSHY